MPVWCVTGKLGSGKTLISVSKIYEALAQGRVVATNLNLNMPKLCGPNARTPRVWRLPDEPTRADFDALGYGNTSYDEKKNGLIVLDECGKWFNAQDWNSPEHKKRNDWLINARKLGWDLIFIIQDASAINKQARKSFLEMIVYCRRMDRMGYPIVTQLFSWAGFEVRPPRVHIGFVTYGDQQHAPITDRWVYRGTHLFKAYDTKQVFLHDYPDGLYMYTPPYLWKQTPQAKRNLRYHMAVSKIWLKRKAWPVAFVAGIVAATWWANGSIEEQAERFEKQLSEITSENNELREQVDQVNQALTADDPKPLELWERRLTVSGYFRYPDREVYLLNDSAGDTYKSTDLEQRGFTVKGRGPCEVIWLHKVDADKRGSAYCGGYSNQESVVVSYNAKP